MNRKNHSCGWGSTLRRWIPVMAWALVIFFFSTRHLSFAVTEAFLFKWIPWIFPAGAVTSVMPLHGILRKAAHGIEYFVLAILLLRAQRRDASEGIAAAMLVRTVCFVIVYAISDEYHQSWVPERTASTMDVLIDASGGIFGAFWMYRRHRRRGIA